MVSRLTDRPIIVRRASNGSNSSGSRSSSRSRSRPRSRSRSDDHSILTIEYVIDNTVPLHFLIQDIIDLLNKLKIHKWKYLKYEKNSSEDFKLKRISGALTNAIYKLEYLDFPPLLLRLYGPNVSSVIDREYELNVLARLSRQNIGADLLGCFTNGRIEQWLNNTNPLTKDLIRYPKISKVIARRMKELHIGINLSFEEITNGPIVWANIEKWIKFVDSFLAKKNLNENDLFLSSFKDFKKVIEVYKKWLFNEKYLNVEDLQNNLVFCHNDTQYGNLLLVSPNTLTSLDEKDPNEDKKLVVIDFEYAGPNVAAYDIADHFCEWMHNYHDPVNSHYIDPSKYPSVEQQLSFIESYIKFNSPKHNNKDWISQETKKLFNYVIYWRVAVNISWCLWGIIQSPLFNKEDEVEDAEKKINENTYKVIEELEELKIDSDSDEEGQGGDTDTFDYFTYSQNKAAMVWGDLVQLGLVDDKSVIKGDLKNVSIKLFELE